MAGKLFIGRKVREIRESRQLSQSAFAERLGISTSYLNQIENNQRPVSASVLVLLAERFQIDLDSFSINESDRMLSMRFSGARLGFWNGYLYCGGWVG